MDPAVALLALVVCAAFTVESALGFGGTVITVALGARLVPVRALLPAFVPLNLALSLWFTVRCRRDIDRALLLRRVLPLMLLGMPLGMVLVRRLDELTARRVFGALVVVLAAYELARAARPDASPRAPLARPVSAALLAAAGVVHGMFATGGPLAVFVAGRELTDKARFRATLSALWLCLNAALLAGYAWEGAVGAASLPTTLALVPALFGGLWLGDRLHARVPERAFRVGVYVMLFAAGASLVLRA